MESNISDYSLQEKVSEILFRNNGSTTEILEALTNSKIEVSIVSEKKYTNNLLSKKMGWGEELILRITTLRANDIDISNNIVIYDPIKISECDQSITQLNYPIGKVLSKIDSTRNITHSGYSHPNDLEHFENFTNIKDSYYPFKQYLFSQNTNPLIQVSELYLIENIMTFLSPTKISYPSSQ